MAKLNANTLVTHPQSGEIVLLAAGGDVPEWASSLVGEHLIEGGSAQSNPKSEPVTSVGDTNGPPPKGGPGSGAPAWRKYAADNKVEVAEDASREDVVEALTKAGVRTE